MSAVQSRPTPQLQSSDFRRSADLSFFYYKKVAGRSFSKPGFIDYIHNQLINKTLSLILLLPSLIIGGSADYIFLANAAGGSTD